MMQELYEKELKRSCAYKCGVFSIATCKYELPDGQVVDRDFMVHPGGASVIPVDSDKNVTVVKQFRCGAGEVLLEIPAGKLEPGEDPFDAVKRELEEEAGVVAENVVPLGFCYATPAISNEKIYIYLATDLKQSHQNLDDDEFIELDKIPLSKLVDMVMNGEITDAKTQIAVLKADKLINK